jgi:hypothetical protein
MSIKLEEYQLKSIEVFISALRTRTLLCNIASVSQSGMSRKMSFLTIADNQVWRFNRLFELDGYKLDKNGDVKVNGCGMDMVWNTVYTLCHKLNQLGLLSDEELPILSQASARVV